MIFISLALFSGYVICAGICANYALNPYLLATDEGLSKAVRYGYAHLIFAALFVVSLFL